MSQKKKSKTLPIIIVALIAVAGGGYYFTQMKDGGNAPASIETAAIQTPETAPEAEQAVSNVESAAGDTKEESASAPNPAGENAQIEVEPGNPVVARVDGKDITRVDVYRFIQTMPQNIQQMPATTVYPMAMEQVINTRIVQNKANAADVSQSDQYKQELEMAKQQIARNIYLQQQVDKKISDGDLKKKYNEYVKQIPNIEERRARHILVETEDKAKAVVEKLNKDGTNFAELAKSLSVGPTAPKGGDLGYFAKSEMVPEFANAAFDMKKNSILQTPVKTQFGWHIIQVLDVRERAKPTFEQMQPLLVAEMRREALDDLLKKWRKGVKVEQFDINGKPLKKGADATGLISTDKKPNQGG